MYEAKDVSNWAARSMGQDEAEDDMYLDDEEQAMLDDEETEEVDENPIRAMCGTYKMMLEDTRSMYRAMVVDGLLETTDMEDAEDALEVITAQIEALEAMAETVDEKMAEKKALADEVMGEADESDESLDD